MNFKLENIQNKLSKILYSDFAADEYDSMRKVIMINTFFIAAILVFFSFSIVNIFLTKNYMVSFLDNIAFGIFLYSYLDLKRTKDLHRASIIGISLLIIFMLLFVFYNHNIGFGLIWTIFIPIFAISMFGSKTGYKISLVYYVALFSLLLYGVYFWNDPSWNLISFIRIFVASLVLTFLIHSTENSFEKVSIKLKELTNTDPLTNLYNRRKIDEIILSKFYDFKRYKSKFCIAILDIDDFKEINDEYGHAVGDAVLIEFSNLLKENSRESDVIGRWGGEEFIYIMQNIDLKDAVANMERVREKIDSHIFKKVSNVTCSIGVANADEAINTVNKLFKAADDALYTSKDNGKNKTSFSKRAFKTPSLLEYAT